MSWSKDQIDLGGEVVYLSSYYCRECLMYTGMDNPGRWPCKRRSGGRDVPRVRGGEIPNNPVLLAAWLELCKSKRGPYSEPEAGSQQSLGADQCRT